MYRPWPARLCEGVASARAEVIVSYNGGVTDNVSPGSKYFYTIFGVASRNNGVMSVALLWRPSGGDGIGRRK